MTIINILSSALEIARGEVNGSPNVYTNQQTEKIRCTKRRQIVRLTLKPDVWEDNKDTKDVWASQTLSLWSPPTILKPKMCSLSSNFSNRSVLVVAGSPDLTSTSLRLPTSRFPRTTHLLMNGLYFCGSSNLLTKDQTWLNPNKHRLLECDAKLKPQISLIHYHFHTRCRSLFHL